MNKRLYIIGNGFDLYHGVRSGYWHFRDYVAKKDTELYEALEKYFVTDELWSDFEDTLAHMDTDTILDDASECLAPYSAPDWSDASHHDYQYEIRKATELVTERLKDLFTRWILQLRIPKDKKLILDTNSAYLNFNYTKTLEVVYRIPANQITYIHNQAVDKNSNLILGHGHNPATGTSYSSHNNEETDPRVAEGNQIIDQYFEETFKDTQSVLDDHGHFFSGLSTVEEVYVLGHSVAEVDVRYFGEVVKNVGPNAMWKVSYYKENEKPEKLQKMQNLGLSSSTVEMIMLDDLHPYRMTKLF